MRKKGLETIFELAKKDPHLSFIGSDLGYQTLLRFKEELPEQFFMEGVSEAHLIGMAAGMATEGYTVFVNTIATFLTRRCFDQVAINLCYDQRKVRLYGNGGGLVYGPLGATHISIDDIALMRALPNMGIICPSDEVEMEQLLYQTLDWNFPLYIRVAKGGDSIVTQKENVQFGRAFLRRSSFDEGQRKILIVTTGIMQQRAIEVEELLRKYSYQTDILHYSTIFPFDELSLKENAYHYEAIFTLEEHQKSGGLGELIASSLMENGLSVKGFHCFHLGADYPSLYGRQEELLTSYQLDSDSLVEQILELCTDERVF